ncbi:hypothetical protein JTE90_026947 [Oedothorax gibbosus]|uniref:Uncharacterized protein n=1 Tax=Oedothorax gibbosus TaxID=931172 RepID=A0AAV6UXV0_9ARAC|nr:hypothetical protein JTE90_026947 [Oedothorax gibbosus]
MVSTVYLLFAEGCSHFAKREFLLLPEMVSTVYLLFAEGCSLFTKRELPLLRRWLVRSIFFSQRDVPSLRRGITPLR